MNLRWIYTVYLVVVYLIAWLVTPVYAQNSILDNADSLHKSRVIGVSTTAVLGYGATMVGLAELWYKDQPKSNFHFFNDNKDWLQMDKFGHVYSAYFLQSRIDAIYQWTGVKRSTALLLSGMYSFVFQGTFEVMDGYSATYGFSYGDVVANTLGIALYTSQELIAKEQVIRAKFSFYPSSYAQYRPNVLGSTFSEQLLKDYNAQTYWFSLPLTKITPEKWNVPNWLCVSFGYSISEKLKSNQVEYTIQNPTETLHFSAYRRYLLSLDIDLSKLPVQKKWLKVVLSNFNMLKIPFPTVEVSKNGARGYWLYY
jgi:hypothetical protein